MSAIVRCVIILAMGAASAWAADAVSVETVAPGVWRLRFGTPEEHVPTRYRSAPMRSEALTALGPAELPFPVAAVRFRQLPRGVVVEVPLIPEEQVFGLGANLSVLNHTGLTQRLCPSDLGDSMNDAKGGMDEGRRGHSHAPVPFYATTRGYGVYLDTARFAVFHCGDVERLDGGTRVDGGERAAMATSTAELYQGRRIRGDAMIVDVPSARGLDVYLFAGPDLARAVQRHNCFAGGGPLPPLWGLGVLYRGLSRTTGDEAVALARGLRDDRMPCDILGLEPGWQQRAYSSTFTFHRQRWPDPVASIAAIRALGLRVNLWEQAFVHPSSPLYEPLKPLSGDLLVWGGLVPDFSLPATRSVFAGHHQRAFIEACGVTGFKLDECDHQPISPTPWSFPESSAFPSGMDGEQMHSLFGLLYQQTLAEPFARRGQRTLGQVRSSWGMATPLPYVLYSDWYDHRDYVRGLSSAGFSGLLWTPEVRDARSVEELYRRLWTTVLSPQMVVNCWYLRLPPWKQIDRAKNNAGELMPDHAAVTTVCRHILEWRTALIPYLYAAYVDYHERGVPPTRALACDFPDDRATWGCDDQYLLGASLLVAPLFTGETARRVHLPAGDWYDFWTGQRFTGPQDIGVIKPVDQIPLYVRGGSILPLATPVTQVADDLCFAITARIYGQLPAATVLHEDDGLTLGGQRNRVALRWDGTAGTVERSGGYQGPPRYRIERWDCITGDQR